MGAPGYTVFCKQGHIVKSVPHHCIDSTPVVRCERCGTKLFAIVTEWGDPDYHEDVNIPVPLEPVSYNWYKVNNNNIKGEVRTPTYDVSRLANWTESIDNDCWF